MAIYGTGVTPLIIMLTEILSNEYSTNVNAMACALIALMLLLAMTFQLPKIYTIQEDGVL